MSAAAMVLTAAIPLFTNGCSDAASELCCDGYKVGATVDVKLVADGNAQAGAFAQASADLGGVTSTAVVDLTNVCRNMAQDLNAPQADLDAAAATTGDVAAMNAWCNLAVKQIGTVKASISAKGSLTVNAVFDPPKCEVDVAAKGSCNASCSGTAKCDYKANPPKCEGGKLEVSCKGGCTAEGSASVACEGGCTGTCEGSCTAQGGVQCSGTCNGSCEATGGVQCQGECKGTCEGTQNGGKCNGVCKGECTVTAPGASCTGTCKGECSVTPPGVKCEGTCKGSCSAKCEARAGVAVKCDGKCDADFEPLKCSGGELSGGCQVDAKCEANCSASVKAKADCTPPQVRMDIQFSGAVDAEVSANIAKLRATLEANLPDVLVIFKARGQAFADLTTTLSANVEGVGGLKPACIIAVGGSLKSSAAQAQASIKVAADVSAAGGAQ
jgi:hypothetical protein